MEKALSQEGPGGAAKPSGPAGPSGVRFAPSPTGRFHVGNLRTAWISWKWARHFGEPWVVRFEDIDGPRVVEGARESQLADMAALGLTLESGDILSIQSRLRERHWRTFLKAVAEGRVYPCFCSRKDVRQALEGASSAPHPQVLQDPHRARASPHSPLEPSRSGALSSSAPPVYSGHCRHLENHPRAAEHGLPSLAWRFVVEEDPSGRSDFIVARSSPALTPDHASSGHVPGGHASVRSGPAKPEPADEPSFAPAYHWACAVDDWDGGYRLLVRAADLAEVVPQHRAIMQWLARSEGKPFAPPAVFHTALVTQNDGHRLEKRTRGVTLDELVAAQYDPVRLIGIFEKSWDSSLLDAWAPGRVFGEAQTTIRLADLGIG